jgi:hypothetical protein
MFHELDQAFSKAPDDGFPAAVARPLRLRKTMSQRVTFWGTNLLIMPFVALCYLTISAEGLRQMMGIFSMRLYKMPVPGAGLLRQWDGWNRLDLAMLMAMLLFGAVAYLWIRVFTELLGGGPIYERRNVAPALFYILSAMVGIILLGDCAIFYFGLESKAASGWSETPEYIPLVATVIYMAGLALIGAWHADYHCSGIV